MPIGLSKGDTTMHNFGSIAKMRNIVCGVQLGQPLRNVQDIEDVRYVCLPPPPRSTQRFCYYVLMFNPCVFPLGLRSRLCGRL